VYKILCSWADDDPPAGPQYQLNKKNNKGESHRQNMSSRYAISHSPSQQLLIMSASDTIHRALVFGASGITGWGIAKQALNYPTPTTFDKVIGLTNRPLSKEQALLPTDDRLVLYSGIDLSAGVDAVRASLGQVDGIAGVTHVYFGGQPANAYTLIQVHLAYTGHGTGFEGIKTANVRMLENAVHAVEKLCPNLKFWTFQTGGKVALHLFSI
jgi:hypothetical protein